MDDLRYANEQAAFYKSLGSLFTDFSAKVQKLVSKQENTRFKTYPTG